MATTLTETTIDFAVLDVFHRTHGSIGQRLVRKSDTQAENLFPDTTFYLLQRDRQVYFGKRPHDQEKLQAEVDLLRCIDDPHVLRVHQVHSRFGIVSRFFPGQSLERTDLREIDNLDVWLGDFLSLARRLEEASLLSHIDLHANNILLNTEGRTIRDWLLVDFERCDWAVHRTRDFISQLQFRVSRILHER